MYSLRLGVTSEFLKRASHPAFTNTQWRIRRDTRSFPRLTFMVFASFALRPILGLR
jgi:hypothetical protein